MIKMALLELSNVVHAEPVAENIFFQGVSIDSRTLVPGNLFIAIPGEKFDGHDYIKAAQQNGAVAALVQKKINLDFPQVVVKDVVTALGALAFHWRNQFSIPVSGLTGSNGKTTLKNMLASILIAACEGDESQVLATQGTLNNHLGLPLTLLRLNATHRYAVIEMGMNHFNEIAYLTKLARPSVAAITNAAACHLEGVGSIEGVAKAKAEIFQGLMPEGIAVLNRDDAFFEYWQQQAKSHPIISFGLQQAADVQAEITGKTLNLKTPQGTVEITLPLLGHHNILNALTATACAVALKIELPAIKKGLETVQPAKGRLERHTLKSNINLIDDTYNANPFSLAAAVATLTTFAGKKILVLGDMKELGPHEIEEHILAGKKIKQAGINNLLTLGNLSQHTAQAFGEGAVHFQEHQSLAAALKNLLSDDTTILVKGSRSMQMEKIVKMLKDHDSLNHKNSEKEWQDV